MNSNAHLLIIAGGLLAAFLSVAPAQNPTPREFLVLKRSGNLWFEGPQTPVSISQDGKWALFGRGPGNTHLYSLPRGDEEPTVFMGTLGNVISAAFCGNGSPSLARFGSRGNENGWFLPGGEIEHFSNITFPSILVCSSDGGKIAYFDFRAPDRGVFVGAVGNYRNYHFSGVPTGMAFSGDGETFYCLSIAPNGESVLSRLRVRTGESQIIAGHLDASRINSQIAVAPDGKHAYLALASDSSPDNESRHKPNAWRWLKIYEMDLTTGRRRLVVDSPGQDNTGPVVANGNLYWTRTVMLDSIVTVPIGEDT